MVHVACRGKRTIMEAMDLDTYTKTKMTRKMLADILGVSPGAVSHWISGRAGITKERALEIEWATGGEVTRHELCPEFFEEPKK